jgi:hypothetical protein
LVVNISAKTTGKNISQLSFKHRST